MCQSARAIRICSFRVLYVYRLGTVYNHAFYIIFHIMHASIGFGFEAKFMEANFLGF